jgi:chromosome segregation ATPase
MPSFLGHMIADDAASVLERSQSPTGFISSDIPLLEFMKVIDKKGGQQKLSKTLASSPQEIRDFLTWASGNKQRPLPPLARKILCLKRAIIKNSIASVGVSNQRRTGETKQLEEIDALLETDGAKDLDNADLCLTEGSKFTSYSTGGTIPPSPATPPPPPAPMSGPGCQTQVTCDSSAMVALIEDIKAALERIESMGPISKQTPAQNTVTNTVTSFKNIPIAHPVFTEIKAQIQGLGEQIEKLSVAGSVANGMSVALKGPGSVRSVVSDPGSIAKSAVEAAAKNDEEGVETFLGQLDDNIDIMKGFTDEQVGIVKTRLAELRANKPAFAPQIDTIVRRIETVGDVPSKVDLEPVLNAIREIRPSPATNAATNAIERLKTNLNPAELHTELGRVKTLLESHAEDPKQQTALDKIDELLANADRSAANVTAQFGTLGTSIQEIKDLVGPIPTIQTLLSDIKTRVEDPADHSAISDQLSTVRTAVQGLERTPEEISTILAKVSAIETQLGEHRQESTVMSDALESIKLKLEDAIARIDGLPTNFDSIVTNVIEQVKPLIDIAKDAVLEQLRLIKQDTELIDMKVEALSKNTRNTKTGVDGLQEQLAQQSAMITEMRDELKGLRTNVTTTCSMGPISDQIAGLTANLEGLRALVEATKAHGDSFDPIFAGIQTSLSDIAGQIAALQATNTGGRNNAVIAEKERYREQVEELQQKLANAQTASNGKNTEIRAKEAELAAAQEELSRARNESPRNKGLISELQERERAKNARIAEAEQRIGTLTQELEQLRASCDAERAEAKAVIERLTNEAEILKSRIQEKDDELAKASARVAELSAAESSLGALKEEKERLNGQIANLSSRAAESETAKANLEAKKAELASAQEKIRGLEISAMNTALIDAAEQEKRELASRLAECEASKRELEASVQSLTDRLAGRNTQSATNASTIEMLRSQLEKQTADAAASLADRNSKYRAELSELEKQHASNIENVARTTVEDMTQQLDQLRQSASAADKKHKEEIEALKAQLLKRGQNANGELASRIADKDKQIADLTRRCEELKAEAVAKSSQEFQAKEAELRREFLEKKKEKDDEVSRLIAAHSDSDNAKDAEIERLRALVSGKEECDEEVAALRQQKTAKNGEIARLQELLTDKEQYNRDLAAVVRPTAEVPRPISAPKPVAPPPVPKTPVVPEHVEKPRKSYKLTDLATGLRVAMMRDNKGQFDERYKDHIARLLEYYTTNYGNVGFPRVKGDIDRLYTSGWIDSIKREMSKHSALLNEHDYVDYLEKLFDIIIRYLEPVNPQRPKTPAYTVRYGRGGSKEKKSKRKTRKNRK